MIRMAGPGEAAALAELAAATFPLACPPGSSPADIQLHLERTLSEEHFERYLVDPEIAIMVLDDAGRLGGYTMLIDRPSTDPQVVAALSAVPSVELSKCYVHPDRHGRGGASALMLASLDWAAGRGAAGVWLGVNSENARAIRFYEKSGFAKVGTKSFTLGGAVESDFVLEYVITPRG